jgi:hypothetical protein
MDFLEDWRLIECLRRSQPTDQNVYDTAAWSAISGLTERSVAEGSRPVEVPTSPAAAGRPPRRPIVEG